MARTKTLSRFAETAKEVFCAMRTMELRVTEDRLIVVCLASHFGEKARKRKQRKWSVSLNRMLRHPGWVNGKKVPHMFAGIGSPMVIETDDFDEARRMFGEFERKAYAYAQEYKKEK